MRDVAAAVANAPSGIEIGLTIVAVALATVVAVVTGVVLARRAREASDLREELGRRRRAREDALRDLFVSLEQSGQARILALLATVLPPEVREHAWDTALTGYSQAALTLTRHTDWETEAAATKVREARARSQEHNRDQDVKQVVEEFRARAVAQNAVRTREVDEQAQRLDAHERRTTGILAVATGLQVLAIFTVTAGDLLVG